MPPAITVQRIAPQLVTFAGSAANFQNLVTGLSQGTQVQLFSTLPDGFTQVVTFTPTAALAPEQIAQALETARQRLIGLGIANPTAEQIANTLLGVVVPTPLGGSRIAGVLAPQNPPSPAVQIQANAAAGSTTPISTTPIPSIPAAATPVTSPVNVQLTAPATPAATPAPTPVQSSAKAAAQPGTANSGQRIAR
ncbi:MAG TPA: hypothetical protein VIG70_04905 [Burkholderiales bacterium]